METLKHLATILDHVKSNKNDNLISEKEIIENFYN